MGIDWSPASVAYAREQAEREGLTCRYVHADFRVAEYGAGYDMAMLIFGELNVFRPTDARHILTRMREALAPGGVLVLEPQTFATVQAEGQAPPSWYSSRGGLFSERPHLLLEEHAWDSEESVATTRFFVVDAAGGDVTRYAMSVQAYTDVQYIALLRECGLRDVRLHPSLTGSEEGAQPDLLAITAYR
jgi:SAM-dependent methyltransferase